MTLRTGAVPVWLMRVSPLMLLLVFATAQGLPALAAEASDRTCPNIILILADDMGPGEPGSAGGLIPTPALDQMVKEGMQFTDAHTSSSVCTPTRYGILTGRYNWRSRLKQGVLMKATDKALMAPSRMNLPTFLQKEGYHTALIGKWHLGVDWVKLPESANPEPGKNKDSGSWDIDYTEPFRNGPVDVGFDEAFFISSSLDMPPYVYLQNDRAITVPTVNKTWKRTGAAAEDFEASECLETWTAKSRAYIQKRAEDPSGKPFFLYLALTSPHTPIVPGKQFKGRYPQYGEYADFIAETDWVVGQVFEQLKESGIDENTLVIFTADNGFASYVHIPELLADGYRPSGSFRGAKASIYEGGHRVPFIVRWPGRVAAGNTCDMTVCTTDFYATFADLLGKHGEIPEDAAEDSFSFYSCLKGKTDPVRPFTIHHSIDGKFAIRQGDWKLILTADNGARNWKSPWKEPDTSSKTVQLYNMKDDPGETKNLEGLYPEITEELVNEFAKALHDGRTTPGRKQPNDGWPYRDEVTLADFPQLQENPATHP